MQTYHQEVQKKRKHARIFWILVFAFATMLYFFFQGKYLNVTGWWNHIITTYETGAHLSGEQPALVRSFGIISIKTTPDTAILHLGSGSLGQDERKAVDYGYYTLSIAENGYLPYQPTVFSIDAQKPYFIEDIALLPLPVYQSHSGKVLYGVSPTEVLLSSGSGIYLGSGAHFTTRMVLPSRASYIGGKYFVSGKDLLAWEGGNMRRQEQEIENFINTCPQITWEYELFYCAKTTSLITEDGQYFTGVTDIRDGMFIQGRTLYKYHDKTIEQYPLTGSGKIDLSHYAVLDEQLHTLSGGVLSSPKDSSALELSLDTIRHSHTYGDDRVFIGSKGGKPYIITSNRKDPPDRMRVIPLPTNVDYTAVTTHNLRGNIMIEGKNALLFLYRGRSDVQWIIEGVIHSYSPTLVIYEKDGVYWTAEWKSEDR